MIKNNRLLTTSRIFFGLLGLSAVVTEIVTLIGRGIFVPANFFSFFTIESNIFAAIVLIVSAIASARGSDIKQLALYRGAATLYMVTTGIVFAVLLSGLEAGVLTAVPWDNTVLHYIMPIVLIVDWLVDPPKARIAFKRALTWMIFPLVYVAYSLIRGHYVAWYPYPFLNPDTKGWLAVAITSVCIAATVVVLTWLLLLATKRSEKA